MLFTSCIGPSGVSADIFRSRLDHLHLSLLLALLVHHHLIPLNLTQTCHSPSTETTLYHHRQSLDKAPVQDQAHQLRPDLGSPLLPKQDDHSARQVYTISIKYSNQDQQHQSPSSRSFKMSPPDRHLHPLVFVQTKQQMLLE
jgi:hypothetical protein